jgi:hypothetical protein
MKGTEKYEYDLVAQPKFREDGFFGGRYKAVKLSYDFIQKDLQGKHTDAVSLYPTVLLYNRYLTEHPNFQAIEL